MKIKYSELIDQTLYFPTEEFNVSENNLLFHDVPLMDVVEQFGTPLKISYLPRISQNIQKAKAGLKKLLKKPNIKRIIDIVTVQNPVISILYWKKL
jgi:arginine decarboxylase